MESTNPKKERTHALNPSITIRNYGLKDKASVLRLAQLYTSWDSAPTEADIEGLASRVDFFLVAEQAGDVIGYICGKHREGVPDEVLRNWGAIKWGYVELLAVDERHRRKGVATALIRRLFEAFKKYGIDFVTVDVPAQEPGALQLYRKLGFEPRAYNLKTRINGSPAESLKT